MAKKIIGFILIASFSFLVSYGVNYFFFNLSEHSPGNQALTLFLLTCALTTVFFFLWIDGIKIHLKPNFTWLNMNSLRENTPGIGLALLFLSVYLYFGRTLNNFGVGQVDNLFDADVWSWMQRIASPDVMDREMRGPHPFTYFIFQPFGRFLNIFTHDPTLSAIIFNVAAGGMCVFLMWLFVKRQFGSKMYAFLMAALLGLSTSHFFFGSVVETYIFSALSLLLFFLILQSNDSSIPALVVGGVLTFGITLTNFIQGFFGFIVARPRLREIIRFAGWTLAVSLIFTYLHAAIYPASKLFFLASDLETEEKFFLDIVKTPHWFIIGRLMYLVRTMLLYSVVAPKVFSLTTEVGSTIPEFRFYWISVGTFHQTSYNGLGQILVILWALILAVSGVVFLWRLIRTRKVEITISFLLCLLLNFLIYINYGQELFLYSPAWTYALILFTAFGLSSFAKNRFFQAGMFLFLVLLAYNQWQFMSIIVESLEQFMRSIS